jgi:hypothetical protein
MAEPKMVEKKSVAGKALYKIIAVVDIPTILRRPIF